MQLIGRSEIVDLPEFELMGVQAKVDTGADSSAIHATGMKVKDLADGAKVLQARLVNGQKARFTDFSIKKVKSSNGQIQERYKVKLKIEVLGKKVKTDFTLSNRGRMRYPILLGKSFLRKRFLVDVSKAYISKQNDSKIDNTHT